MNSDPATNGINEESFRIPSRQRPDGVGYHQYKNRRLVAAKLTEQNYPKFITFCKAKNFSSQSGINYLISTHPEIQPNG